MADNTRKRVLLATIQSTIDVDEVPSAFTENVITVGLQLPAFQSNTVERNVDRGVSFGNLQQSITDVYNKLAFGVELNGSDFNHSALMRCCGLSLTTNASELTANAVSGTSNSVTLDATASSTDDTYNFLFIEITSGAGAGQFGVINDYTGSSKNAYVNWRRSDGQGITSPNNTSVYRIPAQRSYRPISTSFEFVSLYDSLDQQKHPMINVMGTVSASLANGQYPQFNYDLSGKYISATAEAAPTPLWGSAYKDPLLVNNSNTKLLIDNKVHNLVNANFDLNNDVKYANFSGESISIRDRKPSGSIEIESPDLSANHFYDDIISETTFEMLLRHGQVDSNSVVIFSPKVQFLSPTEGEIDEISTLKMNFSLLPYSRYFDPDADLIYIFF